MNISGNAKILLYLVVSSLSFSYLVTPMRSSIGIVIFSLIQLASLYFLARLKKRLVMFVPILILSFNSFISACTIWKPFNFIICFILMSCMFFDFDFRTDRLQHFSHILSQIFSPFRYFKTPFSQLALTDSKTLSIIKRVCVALFLSVPCVLILVALLSSADMVFSLKAYDFVDGLANLISMRSVFRLLAGFIAGLYLTGALYSAEEDKVYTFNDTKKECDLIITNILLSIILMVYTAFVVIQFRYLFAGSTLPDGLTYTEYARKGFFELLALTGINIAVIYTVTILTKTCLSKWAFLSKGLCTYLCAVTVVLLISSFYRMLLYTGDDGLTRLRFFVMGFLIFELIGLLITFVYILKPCFNLPLVYVVIALCYYMVLNIIPCDYIIAKNQIAKFTAGKRSDIYYVFTLSADAIPALSTLAETTNDEFMREQINEFISSHVNYYPDSWQSFNLSIQKAKSISIAAN